MYLNKWGREKTTPEQLKGFLNIMIFSVLLKTNI